MNDHQEQTKPAGAASAVERSVRDGLEADFLDYAAEHTESALALITGLFVGLLEFSVDQAGGDMNAEIVVDGSGNRDITVHARVPNEKFQGRP